MQNFFIIVIVMAFLGGFLSKCNPNQSAEWGGSFFNAIGFKSKEQVQREQLDKLLHKYLKDQVEYLDDSKEEIESLSKIIENTSKHENVDILRLKYLMKQFEDLSTLMVENGKELVNYNQDLRKRNKKKAQWAGESAALSKSGGRELLEKQKDVLDKQAGVLAELLNIQSNPNIRENPQIADRLNTISSKTMSHLGQLRQEQEQIQKIDQRTIKDTSYMKDKMDDLRNKSEQSMRDNRIRLEDQTRTINERMRDQLDRLKDRRY